MIATRLFIISLLYLVVKIRCNSDGYFMHTSFDAANSTVNVTGGETTETHQTTCKITTERLVANAQATFTRVLTGACNAKTIDERLEKLENSLNKRLDEIRELTVRAMTKRWDSMEQNELDFRGRRVPPESNDSPDATVESNSENIEQSSLSRRYDVTRFNNTVHEISTSSGERKVYTYYWRVSNVHEKLMQWETGRSERSSTFHVGSTGYAMYLKFTPKYFPDGTIFVSVGLTKGLHDFKLVWPFQLRIRIKILDQTRHNKPEDRSSRLWDPATICSSHFWGRPGVFGGSDNPECLGLSIPRQLLLGEQRSNGLYVWNDCLFIELTVHL